MVLLQATFGYYQFPTIHPDWRRWKKFHFMLVVGYCFWIIASTLVLYDFVLKIWDSLSEGKIRDWARTQAYNMNHTIHSNFISFLNYFCQLSETDLANKLQYLSPYHVFKKIFLMPILVLTLPGV